MSRKIVLVDDHQIIREGLRSLLDKQSGLEVVAEAADGRTAVKLVRKLAPDLAIMDIGMPDLNGTEATRQINNLGLRTKVIALSMHAQAQFVRSMLEAGASGYLLKDCAVEELVDAIQTVLANRIYLSKQITGVVVEDYVRHLATKNHSVQAVLTPREREILQLIAEGRSTKEIASALHVSIKTVETHRQHVMEKLGIRSIAGLTKYAIREGITSFDQ